MNGRTMQGREPFQVRLRATETGNPALRMPLSGSGG